MFDPSKDPKCFFEPRHLEHIRGIQSYLSQLDLQQPLVHEIYTHMGGLLNESQVDTAKEEPIDPAAAWHAAKTRCAAAEQRHRKATGVSEALAKKLARAKQVVVDIDAEATAHKEVLALVRDEVLAAHKALRCLVPPPPVEPPRKPPATSPAPSHAGKAPDMGWSIFAKFLEELSTQNVSTAGGDIANDMDSEDKATENDNELRQAMAEAREKVKRVADLQQEQVRKEARQNEQAQAQAQQEHEQDRATAADTEAQKRQAAAYRKQDTERAAAAAAQAAAKDGPAAAAAQDAAEDKPASQANAAASARPPNNTQQG